MRINARKAGGLFVVILMIAGMVGGFLVFGDDEQELQEEQLPDNAFKVGEYIFFEFEDETYGIYLKTVDTGKNLGVSFRLDPREAGTIPLEQTAVDRIIQGQMIYVTYNPNQENVSNAVVATAQVARIIPLLHGNTPTVAYTEDADPIDLDVPIKTCADATAISPVIMFEVTGTTQITEENNCIHVQGASSYDLMLAADKLGMNLVGIKL